MTDLAVVAEGYAAPKLDHIIFQYPLLIAI